MSIYDIIQELKDEPSKNAKIEILKREKDNELLKRVIATSGSAAVTTSSTQSRQPVRCAS